MVRLFNVNMPAAVDEPLLEVIHSGYVTQGPKVAEFENMFGDFIENPNVVAVNSGTSALTLAMRLAGVGPHTAIISTPMTCSATNLPAITLGADIIWADVDPLTGLIDPASVEKILTNEHGPAIKAIVCCDWGGAPCDVERLMEIAKPYRIPVIEDAAHAIASEHINGQPVGSVADFTCFSFQAIKHITTIDGGMLACKYEDDAKRAKLLRWFGIDRDNSAEDSRINEDIVEAGYKFHMNDVAAVIGIVQLNHIDDMLRKHINIAAYYRKHLDPYFTMVTPPKGDASSCHWLFTMLLPDRKTRDQFKQHMLQAGIQVSQVHKRNDQYTVFSKYTNPDLPGVNEFDSRQICIPINAGLTDADINEVIKQANSFVEGQKQ